MPSPPWRARSLTISVNRDSRANVESVGMLNEGPRIAQVSAVELDKDVEVKDAQSAGWSLSGFEVRR